MNIKLGDLCMGINFTHTILFSLIFGSCNVNAVSMGFQTSGNPLFEIIASDTGAVINSGLIDDGRIDYDTALGNGSLWIDATLDVYGATSLHDVSLTTNANGSIRMEGLIDFIGINWPDNNFIGDFFVQYDYLDEFDVTVFTFSTIAFAGHPFDGILMTDGPYTGELLNFELTASYLAYVDNPFPTYSPVPLPAAVWLFGSGLIGLIGVARCKKV